MRRRQFLAESGRAALAVSTLPLIACSRERGSGRGGEPELGEGASKGLIGDLEAEIRSLMERAAVPGVSIAIIRDGRLAWRRGFGVKDVATNAPVDDETVFEAASTSKPVFAYAVMKLCEKGVLALDTPLTRYTPDRFLEGDPRLDLVTARHVLTHTSGFPNWRSAEEPLRLRFTPGERWSYSGEGFHYLQSVVNRLMGGRVNSEDCGTFETGLRVCAVEPGIDEFMTSNVLVPFGMTSSGYLWTDAMKAHVARGHDEKGKRYETERTPSRPAVARYGMAGGLYTTPTDYAKFLIEIINPKPTDAFRLRRDSLEEMLRPHVRRTPDSSWALGWQVEHTENGDFLRHGGGNPGFACLVAASVERQSGLVIMTNCENTGYYGVIAKLISGDILPRVLGGKLSSTPA